MFRAKLVLLSVASVLSVVAVLAPAASAKISFEWFVAGHLLASGEQRTFSLNTDGHTFAFHGKAAGLSVLLLSNKVSTENGMLFGGKPGTGEATVIFENVKVDTPAGCTVESLTEPVANTIKTKPLKIEIVEGEDGEVLLLLAPVSHEFFVVLLFLNKGTSSCALANQSPGIEGNILALPLPQKTEVLRQNIVFPSEEQLFALAGGTRQLARFTFATEPATLTGLTLLSLESDAVFGPF
jgi:hypothetical protein